MVDSLRALDRWSNAADLGPAVGADQAAFSALWGGIAVGLSASRTPAWTERHVRIFDRLIARLGVRPDATTAPLPLATLLVLHGLRVMVLADHPRAGRGGPTAHGADAVPQPHELAPLAADLLRHPHPTILPGTVPSSTIPTGTAPSGAFTGGAVLEGTVLGLGLWLHDRRFHTNWHVSSFEPWWKRVAPIAGAAVGNQAALLAWILTPQAPDAAQALLGSLPTDLSRATPLTPTAVAALRSMEALHVLVADEWSLEGVAVLRSQLDATGPTTGEKAPSGAEADFSGGAARSEDEPGWGDGAVGALVAAAAVGGPGRWAALCRTPVATAAQVIDVDFPTLALSRAEWTNGFLNLSLDVATPKVNPEPDIGVVERHRRTTFRIVGAEPRVWWASGLPNITTEMSATAVSITTPLLSGAIEFAPSSY